MTYFCGVVRGAVVDGLPPCKDMQSAGSVFAGLLHWRGGSDADVERECVVLFYFFGYAGKVSR